MAAAASSSTRRTENAIAGAIVAILFGATLSAAASTLSPAVRDACLERIPSEMRAALSGNETSGASEAGTWSIDSEDLDGSGTAEAILTILPAGRPGEAYFFAERDGGTVERKKISFGGGHLARASVSFPRFRANGRLAHVHGREAGQVLLYWNGDALEKVWEVGKVREKESRWFEVEDLDGDEISEVITYYRRELDVFTDEDELSGTGGSDAGLTAGKIDVESVLRYDDGKWKKDRGLLESLR
jgi:hypothetical protein